MVLYERLYGSSGGIPHTRWFVGGRTNQRVHLCVEQWCM